MTEQTKGKPEPMNEPANRDRDKMKTGTLDENQKEKDQSSIMVPEKQGGIAGP